MRQRGATLRDIASALNRAGLTTNSGTAWKPTQVSRLLQMMG
ncbi:recombinase family protein [Paracoccus amoyensis]|nr:recombinase family protein [Paracoccus amoyensis]